MGDFIIYFFKEWKMKRKSSFDLVGVVGGRELSVRKGREEQDALYLKDYSTYLIVVRLGSSVAVFFPSCVLFSAMLRKHN